jgi:hypothetical protein
MRQLFVCMFVAAIPCHVTTGGAAPRKAAPPLGVLGAYVRGPQQLSAGAPAALRVVTHASTSAEVSVAFPDVAVAVTLSGKGRMIQLYHGRTDGGGVAEARFFAPDWPDGSYQLVVEARADDGRHDTQGHEVQVAAAARLYLESDKPLYQPSQIIHLKAVAQRPVDGKPVSSRQATFLVFDARGNEVFRRAAPLSEFGVASADFQLADEITTGSYRARVEADGAAAGERQLSVERYVLPKFKLTVDTDRAWYAPGQRIQLSVEGRYFFGKPVSAGKLTLTMGSQVLHAKLDGDGKAHLELEVPKTSYNESLLHLRTEVVDGAEHREHADRAVTVAADPLRLELVPGALSAVPGADNRVWLVAARPDGSPIPDAEVEWRADGLTLPTTRTDALGVAAAHYSAGRSGGCINLEAGLRQNGTLTWTKRCQPLAQAGALMLSTDRALYPPGAPIGVTLTGFGEDGIAHVDVEKDGQILETLELTMKAGRGEVTLPPDPRRFGTLALVAYSIAPDGSKRRDSHLVYGERAGSLKLALTSDQASFRPGERGRLHVRVLDGDKGVRASVGLVMVDQSLLALRAVSPGSARLYFALAEEASRPSLAMKARPGGYTLERIVDEGQLDDLKQEAARILLAGAVPVSRGWESDPWTQRKNEREARLQKLAAALPKWVETHLAGEPNGKEWRWRRDLAQQMGGRRDPWGRPFTTDELLSRAGMDRFENWALNETNRRLQLIYLAIARAHLEKTLPADPRGGVVLALADLDKLAAGGKLDKSLLSDPWGRPWRIFERKRLVQVGSLRSRYLVASSGPDGSTGNGDDRYAIDYYHHGRVYRFEDVIGIEGALARDAFADGAMLMRGVGMGGGGFGAGTIGLGNFGTIGHGSGGIGEARVRRDFPETMLWLPEVITDANGDATVEATMADSITTWQLQAEAVAADGRIATGTRDIRAFQDFFVDLDLPPAVTQHDELSVPVAVYNYLPKAQRVTLTLEDAGWFTRSGEPTQSIDLGPQQVGVRYFRIRVGGLGTQKLLVRAQGSTASDAIEKPVHITPDGIERAVAFQDRLDGKAQHSFTIPPDAIADASLAQLKIYPSMATHVIEGLDSMLRMPGGCFEQTSSTNYPNALILDYLRKSRKATPEIEKKAQAYLSQGYQRLLSFEVPGGGFSWFGQAPANKILTAYGIEEFHDMARVFNVDPRVIKRTQDWLARQQKADGSWAPDTQFINEGATNHFNTDVVRITAYIAVALQHTGWKGAEVAKAIDFVKRASRPKDPYTLALVTELLAGNDAQLDGVMEELWSQRKDLDKVSSFTSTEKTPTYGDGKSGTLETTALAAYAMLQAPSPSMARVDRAIGFLLGNKDSFGNWYSTQATILSLKALLGWGEKAGQKARGTAVAFVDGNEVGRVRVAPDVEALQVIDLPEAAKSGAHQVEVRFDGQGPVAYQIVGRWWEPKHEAQPSEGLEVVTHLEKDHLKPGEVLVEEVRVRPHGQPIDMPIVTAGVPPGFDVDGEELQKLVRDKLVDKVQQGPREVTFYLTRIDAPTSLTLHLTPRFPEKVQLPASTAYEYYKPERRAAAAPMTVTVGG